MKIEAGLINAQAMAAAEVFRGAVLTIYAGDMALISCSPKSVSVEEGRVKAVAWSGMPTISGAPTRFEVAAGDLKLMSGSVGPKNADMIYEPELIVRGLLFELPSIEHEVI